MRRLPRVLRARDVSAAPSFRAPVWPWSLGTVVVVAAVLLTALGVRHVVAGQSAAAHVVAAPAAPAAAVVGATPLTTHVQFLALDASAGHIVALTSATQPQCPPATACPPAPALTTFTVFDAASGQPLTTTPLTSGAALASNSVLLLADAARHVAYAIAPGAVTRFSTVTGAATGSYALPAPAWQRESDGVLDARSGALVLSGGSQLMTLDAATGRLLASRTLSTGATVSGLTLDPTTGKVYALLLQPGAAQASLTTYDEATLTSASPIPLPAGARLGPLNPASGTLYLPGAADRQCAYSVRTAQLLTTNIGICDAMALGWNSVTGRLYTSDAAGLSLRDAASARPVAALPVRAAWPGDQPLLVDEAHGLLYVPDARGTVLIVRDGTQPAALTPGGALLLARAALAELLPDTNQDPPFVAPDTFPVTAGVQSETYWIHFSDLGWQGPYPGDAASAVQSAPDGSGGYQVTFTISWNQLFRRTHSWTCDVSPTGAVRLASQTGDAVP